MSSVKLKMNPKFLLGSRSRRSDICHLVTLIIAISQSARSNNHSLLCMHAVLPAEVTSAFTAALHVFLIRSMRREFNFVNSMEGIVNMKLTHVSGSGLATSHQMESLSFTLTSNLRLNPFSLRLLPSSEFKAGDFTPRILCLWVEGSGLNQFWGWDAKLHNCSHMQDKTPMA